MIHVFGGLFLDIYIKKKEIHTSKINLKIGGSGFNIYKELNQQNDPVIFHGNLGNDQTSETILTLFKRYNHNSDHLNQIKGSSGVITYVNNEAFAVQRGVNNYPLNCSSLEPKKYAVITTEIAKKSIREILSLGFDYYFIDVGPRPFILNDLTLPENTLLIGNTTEAQQITVDVIKRQEKGGQWHDLIISGNGMTYDKTIGSGDVFTANLIHQYIQNYSKKESLKYAIQKSEAFLKRLNQKD
jgi:sugar/nucleoside kinase (ribokinase family)